MSCVEHPSRTLERIVSGIDLADAMERYQLERDDYQPSVDLDCGNDSLGIETEDSQKNIISWHHDDPENPYNWSIV